MDIANKQNGRQLFLEQRKRKTEELKPQFLGNTVPTKVVFSGGVVVVVVVVE